MTSNDTYSPSPTKTKPPEDNWNKLLGEPKKLRGVVKVLNSQGWEGVEEILNLERWHHLELAADSNDSGDREKHRIIACYIKEFTLALEDIRLVEEQSRHPEQKPNIDPNYMEFDSGTNSDPDSILNPSTT